MLILAAAFWGSGNIANKTLLTDIGPFTALALRGAIAAVIVFPFVKLDRVSSLTPGYCRSLMTVSVLFVAAATFQQAAFQWTTVTNAGFLVNTCTVLTPLLAWFFLREQPKGHVVIAALITLAGAWLMCGGTLLTAEINPGDLACLVSAVFYAGWAIALGRHAVRYGRPLMTAAVQFAVTAVVLAPFAIALERPTLTGVFAAGPEVLYLAVFCTAGACVLTTIAQRQISASVAVILLSLESVFGAAAAFVILDERPAVAVIAGGAMMLLAVLVAMGRKGRRTMRG
jgi:drug/metabolite transporter (DMT)-like permease